MNTRSGSYAYTPSAAAVNALRKGEIATDSFTLSASDGIISTTANYSVNINGADDLSFIFSANGKNILRGTSVADNFIFCNEEKLIKENADIIVNFDKFEGDMIHIDDDLHGLSEPIKFKRTKNRRKLKRLASSNVDVVYFKRKKLFVNSNGKAEGFSDDDEKGLLAVLKGRPALAQDSLEIF